MRQTTGEEVALDDVMGGRRAEIDTGRRRGVTETATVASKRQHGVVRERPNRPQLP